MIFVVPVNGQQNDENSSPDSLAVVKKAVKKTPRGFLGFSIGPSFPVGNFGKSDWDDEKSGFARRGYQFTAIDFGIKFVPNFGITFGFKGANVPMDVQKIANFYAQEYGGEFYVSSTRWNFGGIYLGPFVSIPTKIVDIDFRFGTGMMLAFSPKLEVSRGQDYAMQEASVGPSISVTLGTGARFNINRWFGASVGVEYLRARPTFTVEYSSNTQFDQETVYQNISVVNVSAGLLFRLF